MSWVTSKEDPLRRQFTVYMAYYSPLKKRLVRMVNLWLLVYAIYLSYQWTSFFDLKVSLVLISEKYELYYLPMPLILSVFVWRVLGPRILHLIFYTRMIVTFSDDRIIIRNIYGDESWYDRLDNPSWNYREVKKDYSYELTLTTLKGSYTFPLIGDQTFAPLLTNNLIGHTEWMRSRRPEEWGPRKEGQATDWDHPRPSVFWLFFADHTGSLEDWFYFLLKVGLSSGLLGISYYILNQDYPGGALGLYEEWLGKQKYMTQWFLLGCGIGLVKKLDIYRGKQFLEPLFAGFLRVSKINFLTIIGKVSLWGLVYLFFIFLIFGGLSFNFYFLFGFHSFYDSLYNNFLYYLGPQIVPFIFGIYSGFFVNFCADQVNSRLEQFTGKAYNYRDDAPKGRRFGIFLSGLIFVLTKVMGLSIILVGVYFCFHYGFVGKEDVKDFNNYFNEIHPQFGIFILGAFIFVIGLKIGSLLEGFFMGFFNREERILVENKTDQKKKASPPVREEKKPRFTPRDIKDLPDEEGT